MTYTQPDVGISSQQICDLYARRRLARGPELARMAEVQQMYDGSLVIPLPELNKNERSSLPNRVKTGLTQISERVASVMPNIWCPPVRPGFMESEKRAVDRRRALLGWWGNTRMRLVLRQRARYLQGYGSSPVRIRWDPELEVPVWCALNPLTVFPSILRGPEEMLPADCITETFQPLSWLQENYPLPTLLLYKGGAPGKPADRDAMFTILEYTDANECVLVAMGAKPDQYNQPPPGSMAVCLDRYPNRSGRCPVVIPRQISLSAAHGQFDGMAGMHQTEAMLTAMSIIATRKGVFQDEWLVAHPNEEPEIVQTPVSALGIPGIVKGGTLVPRGVDPQFQTNITIDRLASAQKEQAGLSPELAGQSQSNVRTGIRSAQLLSNVIDFPIQEAQELFAESLQEEDRTAIAFAKGYGGPKSFYVNWDGARGPVTYDPDTTFETDQNSVTFPLAGADQAGLVISSGQRVGMGTMSKQKFMEIDPLIDDPEREHDRIIGESLQDAVLESIKQQALAGQIPPTDIARIYQLVVSDEMELFEAIDKAHQEAQARQAAVAPAGAPEAQPGLGAPGMGAEQQGPPPAPPELATMLASLRSPQRITPQEAAVGATAGGPRIGA